MENFIKKFGLEEISGYKFHSSLKGGKMSYTAIYKNNYEKVVVKFLLFPRNEFELSFFQSEIENLNRLSSSKINYVVKPLSHLIKHPEFEIYYFIIEYLDGISLAQYFQKTKLPLSLQDSILFLKNLSQSLSITNALGIIHKDFHFGNIIKLNNATLEQNDPGLRIIDFGLSEDFISKFYNNLAINATLRHIGAVSSWSPEYLTNPNSITTAHDIWALATLFFKMLTNQWPFEANSFGEYYNLILNGNYNKLFIKKFDGERIVEHLLNRMFEINPQRRIRQGRIIDLCEDYLDGKIDNLKMNKRLENFYFQFDGDIVSCSRCQSIVHPDGVKCPSCGNIEEEYLDYQLGIF